jgi:hypothetical protein
VRRVPILVMSAAAAMLVVAIAGCGDPPDAPAFLESYSRTNDPRVIVVYFTTGECDTFTPPRVFESSEEVAVEIRVQPAPEDNECETIAPARHAQRVELEQDLGSRRVRGREADPDLVEVPLAPDA